jgi:TRAP-type C4-dicarboxylate transport system permease small subunit
MQAERTAAPNALRPNVLRRAAEIFLVLTLAGMVVAVFVNVVLRYGFGTGIVFYEELSRLLFVWLVCVGAVLATADDQHLGFDMLTTRLHGGALAACTWVARIAIAFGLVLVVKGSWEQVGAGMQSFSTVMGYPLALAAVSTLVMALAMLVLLTIECLRNPRGIKQSHTNAHAEAGVD